VRNDHAGTPGSRSGAPRFAVVGPFAIENYGDHVFREVVVASLRERHNGAVIDFFDVIEGPLGFDHDTLVHRVDDLEAMHQATPYTSVVLAGGSVVHFETLEQLVVGGTAKEPYPLWRGWVIAATFASRFAVPLLWNSPEAPLDFAGWRWLVAQELVTVVDFLSVRDEDSRRVMASLGRNDATVAPDSGWLLGDIWPRDDLNDDLPPRVRELGPFVTFHCNHRLSDADATSVVATLERFVDAGYAVVLLPLAPTNAEAARLADLQRHGGGRFVELGAELGMRAIAATIAAGSAYVGLSFHGAITAAVFGRPAIAFDYEIRRKTRLLYDAMGCAEDYTTDAVELDRAVERLLAQGIEARGSAPGVAHLQRGAREHAVRLADAAVVPCARPSRDLGDLVAVVQYESDREREKARELRVASDNQRDTFEQFAQAYAQLTQATEELAQLRLGYDECYRQYQELRAFVDRTQSENDL
jgi:hypothetical protein